MRKMIASVPTVALVIAITLSALTVASADTLKLSLAAPAQTAAVGFTVSFTATVSAPITNVAAVYLNSDSNNVDYPLTVDDTGFFSNFPLSLAPGGSFTGQLFAVTIPNFASSPASYQGYFEIDGGANSNALNLLASVNFQVIAAPEPMSIGLLTIGIISLVLVLRRRRCVT